MKTSSAKAKGRRLCLELKEKLLSWAPDLKDDDIQVTSSGAGGEDLKLSPLARSIYPISFECKNTETIQIWAAYKQACDNAREHIPVVCFSRNRSETMITLKLDDFLRLIR
jgi:hypothetical protein